MIAYLIDGEPLPYAVSVIVSGSNAVALEGALILSHCSTSGWASARGRSSNRARRLAHEPLHLMTSTALTSSTRFKARVIASLVISSTACAKAGFADDWRDTA